jgi:hypothetical protein
VVVPLAGGHSGPSRTCGCQPEANLQTDAPKDHHQGQTQPLNLESQESIMGKSSHSHRGSQPCPTLCWKRRPRSLRVGTAVDLGRAASWASWQKTWSLKKVYNSSPERWVPLENALPSMKPRGKC